MQLDIFSANHDRTAFVDAPGVATLHPKTFEPLKANEVRVEVIYSGICGSDLHTYRGRHPSVQLPSTIGHEVVGRICEVGSNVKNLELGQRVVVEPLYVCGECDACLRGQYSYCDDMKLQYRIGNGFMCKYFATQSRFVYPIPDTIDDASAAVIEVLAIAVRSIRRADLQMGDDVLVTGAGTVGILVAALCSQLGARRVIISDIVQSKRQLALSMGATHDIDAAASDFQKSVEEICPKGVSRAFECVGLEKTLLDCFSSIKKGGTVVQVGIFESPSITLPAPMIITKEVTYKGCQSYNWDFEAAIALAEKIDLGRLVTHKYPMSEIDNALNTANDKNKNAVKVLCYPDW